MHRLQNRTKLCCGYFPIQRACFDSLQVLVSILSYYKKDSCQKLNLLIEHSLSGAQSQDKVRQIGQDATTKQLQAITSQVHSKPVSVKLLIAILRYFELILV